jgi:hypothetical protein
LLAAFPNRFRKPLTELKAQKPSNHSSTDAWMQVSSRRTPMPATLAKGRLVLLTIMHSTRSIDDLRKNGQPLIFDYTSLQVIEKTNEVVNLKRAISPSYAITQGLLID